MSAWLWIALIYPWTVVAALVFLERTDKWLLAEALLWPAGIAWAYMGDSVRSAAYALTKWPRQERLIEFTDRNLSRDPERRRHQVEALLSRRQRWKVEGFLLRRYFRWLTAEQQRLEAGGAQ